MAIQDAKKAEPYKHLDKSKLFTRSCLHNQLHVYQLAYLFYNKLIENAINLFSFYTEKKCTKELGIWLFKLTKTLGR